MQSIPYSVSMCRRRAREVLQPNFSTALMAIFLVSLPNLLSQLYSAIVSQPLNELSRYYLLTIAELTEKVTPDSVAQLESVLNQANTELFGAMLAPSLLTAVGISLLVSLITPALELGCTAYLMKLVRGQQGQLRDVLSRMSSFFRCILLNIAIYFKVLAWMLPGIAVCFGSLLLLLINVNLLPLMLLLYFGGLGLSVWLGIRAALGYVMANYVLADEPATGVMACIRTSQRIMQHQKGPYMGMFMFFVLLMMIASTAASFFDLLHPVLGTVASLALQMVVSLYMLTSMTAFYLSRKGELVLQAKVVMMQQQPTDNDDDDQLT